MKKIASIRYRILAFVIDYLIFITIFYAMCVFYGQPSEDGIGYQLNGTPAFIMMLIGFFLCLLAKLILDKQLAKD